MGTNTLGTKNPGDIISSDDPNQFKSALGVDVVPRNVSGAPTDIAGSLGSTIYRWLTGYFKKLIIGTAADDFSIEGTSSSLFFKLAGVTKGKIDTNGFDGTYLKTASVPLTVFDSTQRPVLRSQTFTSDSTFTVPTYVTEIIPEGCSGGGGGGGGGGGNGSGGAGGASADYIVGPTLTVTPGESLVIDIGAGGGGGLGNNQGGPSAGTAGSPSRILRGTTVIWTTNYSPGGGNFGTSSGTNTVTGPSASGFFFPGGAGGNGGKGNPGLDGTAGTDGGSRTYKIYVGGTAGSGAVGGGGGGGGGGAGVSGNGGAGGSAGNTGANGQDGSGYGAGGGGGGGSKDGGSGGTGTGGNGGAGISGVVKILWSAGST